MNNTAMWRTILLGKLGVSIIACLIVAAVCIARLWTGGSELGILATLRWIGAGVFFLMLGLLQIVVTYVLTKRTK